VRALAADGRLTVRGAHVRQGPVASDDVAGPSVAPSRAAVRTPGPRPSQTPVPAATPPNGRPLAPEAAAAAERRLAHDFPRVRVHDDGAARAAAASVGAEAYTVGSSVFLGAGVSESSEHGRHVLAHELVHVAQQEGAAATSTPVLEGDDGPAEREARELAEP